MKKLTAIFLILIFLFNLGGYRLYFYYVQQQSDLALQNSFDKDEYDEAIFITIKIPISLPYQTDWKEFERVDGEINCDGKIYKYVKRKVCKGELVLLCLPDRNKMQLEKAKDDYFSSSINSTQSNSNGKSDSKSSSYKNTLSDYDQYCTHVDLNNLNIIIQIFSQSHAENLISFPHTPQGQPPNYIAA